MRRVLKGLRPTPVVVAVFIMSLLVFMSWTMDNRYQESTLNGHVIFDMYPKDAAAAADLTTPSGSLPGPRAPVFPREETFRYSTCFDCEPRAVARVGVTYDGSSLTYTFLEGPWGFHGKTLVFRAKGGVWSRADPDCRGGTLGWPNRPRMCE